MSPFLAKDKQQCDSSIAAGLCELQQQGQHTLIYPIQLLLWRFSRQTIRAHWGRKIRIASALTQVLCFIKKDFILFFIFGRGRQEEYRWLLRERSGLNRWEESKREGGEGGDGRLTVMEIPADMKAKGQCIFFLNMKDKDEERDGFSNSGRTKWRRSGQIWRRGVIWI